MTASVDTVDHAMQSVVSGKPGQAHRKLEQNTDAWDYEELHCFHLQQFDGYYSMSMHVIVSFIACWCWLKMELQHCM